MRTVDMGFADGELKILDGFKQVEIVRPRWVGPPACAPGSKPSLRWRVVWLVPPGEKEGRWVAFDEGNEPDCDSDGYIRRATAVRVQSGEGENRRDYSALAADNGDDPGVIALIKIPTVEGQERAWGWYSVPRANIVSSFFVPGEVIQCYVMLAMKPGTVLTLTPAGLEPVYLRIEADERFSISKTPFEVEQQQNNDGYDRQPMRTNGKKPNGRSTEQRVSPFFTFEVNDGSLAVRPLVDVVFLENKRDPEKSHWQVTYGSSYDNGFYQWMSLHKESSPEVHRTGPSTGYITQGWLLKFERGNGIYYTIRDGELMQPNAVLVTRFPLARGFFEDDAVEIDDGVDERAFAWRYEGPQVLIEAAYLVPPNTSLVVHAEGFPEAIKLSWDGLRWSINGEEIVLQALPETVAVSTEPPMEPVVVEAEELEDYETDEGEVEDDDDGRHARRRRTTPRRVGGRRRGQLNQQFAG